MGGSVIFEKSADLAIQTTKLCQNLFRLHKDDTMLIHQLLYSGTCVGSYISKAQCCSEAREFRSYIGRALQELVSARYWLLLLHKSGALGEFIYWDVDGKMAELQKMFEKICK